MAGKTNSSITNVAALANVSIATVSRVLSGKRDKDDDIARRVRAAAEQLNYSVNYAASALRSDVTNAIGLVIPSATDSFSAQLLDEIEYASDANEQQLMIGIGNDQTTQIDRIESLVSRHVDGLIVVPAVNADLTDWTITPAPCQSCKSAGTSSRSEPPWSPSTKTPPWSSS